MSNKKEAVCLLFIAIGDDDLYEILIPAPRVFQMLFLGVCWIRLKIEPAFRMLTLILAPASVLCLILVSLCRRLALAADLLNLEPSSVRLYISPLLLNTKPIVGSLMSMALMSCAVPLQSLQLNRPHLLSSLHCCENPVMLCRS